MSDNLFKLGQYAVQNRRYGAYVEENNKENAVRVYRYSPDRVMLQIRGEKAFVSATVPFDLAKQIAAALIAETE